MTGAADRPAIVATLGPATREEALRRRLLTVATCLRLNTAHLAPGELAATLAALADLFARAGTTLPVVLDLQGAKVRIGDYPTVAAVPPRVELRLAAASPDPAVIPVPHASVFREARPGDLLHLNDRRVGLRVREVGGGGRLLADCIHNGPLAARKGLNCAARRFELAQVTPGDRDALAIGVTYPFVDFAVSFVADGGEAALFRPLAGGRRLVAKVERAAALAALPALARDFDELWLCRGDLGAELGLRQLGPAQAAFVRALPGLPRPCLLAGEVLGSLAHVPWPSRSEVVHLHDALAAGFAGFVLSDETAAGAHVAATLDFLAGFFALPGAPAGFAAAGA